jgi:hypothetical protein
MLSGLRSARLETVRNNAYGPHDQGNAGDTHSEVVHQFGRVFAIRYLSWGH